MARKSSQRRPENRLLALLPQAERRRLVPSLAETPLVVKQVLYDVNHPIQHMYFPVSGVCSLVLVMNKTQQVAEVCTIGNEGVVGLPVFLGAAKSPTRAVTQVPGAAWRMEIAVFKEETSNGGPLHDVVRRYTQAMINQISQSVACNSLHSVEERMCRWLLLTSDRVGSEQFPLTQEFLAQMLGVRRSTVTVVAGLLQKAGLIQYRRGLITILRRKDLERASCECYRVVRDEFERLLGAPIG